MDVFKELTGVDLMDLQEKKMRNDDDLEDQKKNKAAELKAKLEEIEKKKKEE